MGVMTFISSILYSCVYEPHVIKKERENMCKQTQLNETYDDSVIVEGRVIHVVNDDYDHPYLKECINGNVIYIPYPFNDGEDASTDPNQSYYVKNKNYAY